jgi:Helicase associated domain
MHHSSCYQNHIVLRKMATSRTWQENFDALLKYKAEHGDCLVPRSFEDTALVSWVDSLRSVAKVRAALNKEFLEALDSVGFVWESSAFPSNTQEAHSTEEKWCNMFGRLVEFKKLNEGNCRVPLRSSQDRQLGLWVARQRRKYRANTLSLPQRKLLEDINFHSDLLCCAMGRHADICQNECNHSLSAEHDAIICEGSLDTPSDTATKMPLDDQLMESSCPPGETQQALEGLLMLGSVSHSSDDTTGGTMDEAASVDSASDDFDDSAPDQSDLDALALLVYDAWILLDGSATYESHLTVYSQILDDSAPDQTDLDALAVLVYDLCVLLDGSASCESQLTVYSQFLDGVIQSLKRGRDPSSAHLTGSDPFSRLVPLVEELAYLVDLTNDVDVIVVRTCEMVLVHAICKMEDAEGTDSEDDGEKGR